MDQLDPTNREIKVTVHRGGGPCGDEDLCDAFTTIDTDPEGGYMISKPVTDPAIIAAHAHKIGPGEILTRMNRAVAPEVFGG